MSRTTSLQHFAARLANHEVAHPSSQPCITLAADETHDVYAHTGGAERCAKSLPMQVLAVSLN
jgi:hypothetical protein